MAKLQTIPPFVRGDTPLFSVPVTISGVAADLTGYTAYLTITTNRKPSSNSDAFLHVTMVTDTVNSKFTHQFTNTETENLDPDVVYYLDVQINKSPASTNNFTILRGTFRPLVDFGRGLT